MPFSRYQIRNEYSLADPELYKAADKDDPEALLEGVAMAGLVGVLRQLGDLAEFAAEIFHDLHEEVMVTATRGHGLLVRVQQLESEFPSIERAFLSQTGHSAFFSSSGISWHPNLQKEQNLITKGDLPRFVMDSYEECRGPPRLFLLDKFDVAGAGACLKRYTDPSFYKVEASSYEMSSLEAQRDKKIRKTKKKGSRWKNGETPEVWQPSHVKLHQLLLEERVQNGASEPARRVKLKKRQSKFPFDTESGKGYMEKLLSSPLEDKLVHEVPVASSPLRLPTNSSGGPGLETNDVSMVDSPLGFPSQNRSPYESPSVDKMVSREHMDNMLENLPGRLVLEPTSSIGLQAGGVYSGMEKEVEEKHISVDEEGKSAGTEDGYQSNDVASEADNYVDALATMESEIETDAELRANSDPSIKQETYSDANVEQLQSQFSDSQSASDDGNSSLRKKITSFSYSDTTSTSADNTSPHGVGSPQAFACTEIPFRPRVSPNQVSVNCIEVSDISSHKSATDPALPVDQGAIFKESTSKESDLSRMSSNNCVNVNSPKRTEEHQIDPKAIIASTSELADVHSPKIDGPSSSSFVRNPQCDVDNEDHKSNSSLVISHVEEQPVGPSLEEIDIYDADVKPSEASFSGDIRAAEEIEYGADTCSLPNGQLKDNLLESKSDPAEAWVSYSSEDETELKERETVSADSESKVATAAVSNPPDDRNGDNNLPTLEDEKELEQREPESFNSETKDVTAAVSVPDDVDSNESKGLSTCEDTELEGREVESVDSETEATTFAVPVPGAVEKDEDHGLSTPKELGENGLVIVELGVVQDSNESVEKMELSEQSIIYPELDSIPSAHYDHSHIQFLDSIRNSCPATCGNMNENDVDNPFAKKELTEQSSDSGEKMEPREQSVISPELDSVPSASYDHLNIQYLDSIPTSSLGACGDVTENDVDNPSANLKILQDESLFVIEKTGQNGLQTDISPAVDFQHGNHVPGDQSNAQFPDSSPILPLSTDAQTGFHLDVATAVSSSSKCVDQDVESKSLYQLYHIDKLEATSSILIHSIPIEEKVDQPHMQSHLQLESIDSQNYVDHETPVDIHSEPYPVNHESLCLEQGEEFQGPVESTTSAVATSESTLQSLVPVSEEPSIPDVPQLSSHINLSDQVEYLSAPVFSGFNMLPQLAPINLEEMPPLPPLPPMQWRMGKLQNASLTSRPDDGQHSIDHFPPVFPQIANHTSPDRNENAADQKFEHDYEDTQNSSQVLPTESSLHTEEGGNLVISSEVNAVKFAEQFVPQPPFNREQSQNVSTSGQEFFWTSSISSLHPADDERPNCIRPMKIQRPRTPLIDAVAAHDKSKLRKVSEQARPLIPKEEERDTLLEQIRAKSFNLKPAIQARPSIQGPTTNLRVAAILEKANAIRQALAGSDDDEDGDDSWSDS